MHLVFQQETKISESTNFHYIKVGLVERCTRIKPARNDIVLMVRRPIFQASDWSSDTVVFATVSLDQSEGWKNHSRTTTTISLLAGFILIFTVGQDQRQSDF